MANPWHASLSEALAGVTRPVAAGLEHADGPVIHGIWIFKKLVMSKNDCLRMIG